MFIDEGCHVIDADTITHELLSDDAGVADAVVREFGPDILDSGKKIDRRKLGAVVFADPARREALTRILHPVIFVRQNAFLERVAQQDPDGIGIVDAALMIETGRYKIFDKIVVVTCSSGQQRERLRQRGLDDADIDRRIGAQMPMEEKIRVADYVIDNSGTIEATRGQVAQLVPELLRISGCARSRREEAGNR
jgi:dephospho-CoA kinase